MPATISPQATNSFTERARRGSSTAPDVHAGPILVASDGTPASTHALSAAAVVARAVDAPAQVISVMEPISAYVPAANVRPIRPRWDAARIEGRLAAVRNQSRIAGGTDDWTIDVKLGDRAPIIARLARQRQARLLVMGMHRHTAADRWFGGDTVFDVVRLGDTPILVVPRAMDGMPRTAVIGVDLLPWSASAAREALAIFPTVTTVYLVHVTEPDAEFECAEDRVEYFAAVRDTFAQLGKILAGGPDRRIIPVERTGKPASELVAVAGDVHADLLVVGSHPRGLFKRLVAGTMATRVLRGAECPVLVVPPSPGADFRDTRSSAGFSREAMAERVRELSARNAGRRVLVEIDNPEIGAQALAVDYTLQGLDYDPRDGRLQVFLGGADGNDGRHLTHTIGEPENVDALRGTDGLDQVLRVTDRAGQMLITFLS
ncbi:MAG: universal stress protein [Gemmatimonadaceae bacterium]